MHEIDWHNLKARLLSGERVGREEAVALMTTPDVLRLGQVADQVRRRKSGQAVYYTLNLNLNPTNICLNCCPLCAYWRDVTAQDAYVLTVEHIADKVREFLPLGLEELHVVGGLHPEVGLDYYRRLFRTLHKLAPRAYIQGLTAVEVDYLSRREQLPLAEVLQQLKAAGLEGLPGGGAEIFSPRVREIICPNKISGDRWLEVMETAHQVGVRTNATMLYGHIETAVERVDHLLALRELQDRTGGFKCFVPLAFHSHHTALAHLPPTTDGVDDLRVLAVGRIVLDNFAHVKALWTTLGPKMAEVSLNFGVDDLGGISLEEKIVRAAGAQVPEKLEEATLLRLIAGAGRTAVRSNSGYTHAAE